MAEPAAPRSPPNRIRIGRLWIDAVTQAQALDRIAALVESGRGGSVFTPNVDHVVKAEDDPALQAAYSRVSLSIADGQPLVWASRLLRAPLPERVAGSDLIYPLMQRAARNRWRVYLLGGGPSIGEQAAARLRTDPGVEIAGVDAPVLSREPTEAEEASIERVRAARPHLVAVALGNPKQEMWIDRALPRIAPAVCLGIGGSLDFIAGKVRRAPVWMRRAGLEWLLRLAQEPRRLARRYLWEDPKFLAILWRTRAEPRATRVQERATAQGFHTRQGA